MIEGNGSERIERTKELTAEAIRQVGLKIADDLRELGKKAKAEVEELNQTIEETAQAIVEALSNVADQTDSLLATCQAASNAVTEHRRSITRALPRVNTDGAIKAVEATARSTVEVALVASMPKGPAGDRGQIGWMGGERE